MLSLTALTRVDSCKLRHVYVNKPNRKSTDELAELRSALIQNSLFPPTTLMRAIERLGFVQADPIRAPARAQDLILRHRVKNYKAGGLEKRYPKLDLDEDFTFAYGFLPNQHRDLLHPRCKFTLSPIERKVVNAVKKAGTAHPVEVDKICGGGNTRNAWGGQSKLTKQALEKAHHHGFLRVARRDKGIRVYEVAKQLKQELSKKQRFKELLKIAACLFGPTSESFLMKEARYYRHLVETPAARRVALAELIEESMLERRSVAGVEYIWPLNFRKRSSKNECVRLLAPFDPVVRDRDRFEQLWGWTYRFEAYTPAAKRIRGYYALPLLWKEDIIGWANAKVVDAHLQVETGYVRQPQDSKRFKKALDAEIGALANFLRLADDAWTISSDAS